MHRFRRNIVVDYSTGTVETQNRGPLRRTHRRQRRTKGLGRRAAALGLDALRHTHPVYCPVRTPAEVGENFDLITYEKGASVVRMIERFLGAETFREAYAATSALKKRSCPAPSSPRLFICPRDASATCCFVRCCAITRFPTLAARAPRRSGRSRSAICGSRSRGSGWCCARK
ncbi:MAG: hypothetical protein HC822_02810, partial [Oscillochloris sp.]|nr:hypothetical protein [Oscillochloris sp.]